MAHEVETMAFTNEVPWHGLGFPVLETISVSEMLKAAKLNWKVERLPLTFEHGGKTHTAKDFFALVRDRDHALLDVAGKAYKPVQNEEAFAFFREFVESGKAKMETAGSLRGGRYVWGLANLGTGFTLANGDVVKGYLLVVCPHEVGKSLIIKWTTVRVVCNNTLTLALERGGSEFRRSHRTAFDEGTMARAKEVLGIARDQVGMFEKTAKRLAKLKLSRGDTILTLAPIFQPQAVPLQLVADETLLAPKMKIIMRCLDEAPGAIPGTGWGVLNAVTYWADHLASRTSDKRLANAWFGRTAGQKEKVLAALDKMAS